MSRALRRVSRVVSWLAFALAILAFAFAVTLFAIERSGLLAHVINGAIAARIEARLPGEAVAVEVGDARLGWYDPALHLRDVRVRLGAEEHAEARFDELDVELRPFTDPVRVVRGVHVSGGRVRLSATVLQRVDTLVRQLGGFAARDANERQRGLAEWVETLPRFVLDRVTLAILVPPELGLPSALEEPNLELELQFGPDAAGVKTLLGRARPVGAWAGENPARVEVWGRRQGDAFAVVAQTNEVPLDSEALHSLELPVAVSSGRLAAEGRVDYRWGDDAVWAFDGRVVARDLNVFVEPAAESLTDGRVEAHLSFALHPGNALPGPDGWELALKASTHFRGDRLELNALGGRAAGETLDLRAWLAAPDVRADPDLIARLLAGDKASDIVVGLQPRGQGGLYASFRVPRDELLPLGSLAQNLHWLGHAHLDGRVAAAFAGLTDRTGRRQGIPYPFDSVRGDVLLAKAPSQPLDHRLALRIEARRDATVLRGDGLIRRSPFGRQAAPLLDLAFELSDLPLGPELGEALTHFDPTAGIWHDFAPRGGHADARFRVYADARTNGTTVQVEVDVHDAALTWKGVPAPMHDVQGSVAVRLARSGVPYRSEDGDERTYRPGGVAYAFEGRAATVGHVAVTGLHRGERPPLSALRRGASIALQSLRDRTTSRLRVAIEDLPLRGRDYETLAASYEAVGRSVRELGPSGRVDAVYEGGRVFPRGPFESRIVARPRGLDARPRAFPLALDALRGAVSVTLVSPYERGDEPEPVIRVALDSQPRFGGRMFAWSATDDAATNSLAVHASGLRVEHASLRGALIEALSNGGQPASLPRLGLRGSVDALTRVALAADAAPTVAVHLRGNELVLGGRHLRALHGTLEQQDGIFRSRRLEARLGRAPIRFEDVAIGSYDEREELKAGSELVAEAPLAPRPGEWSLVAKVSSPSLPLDVETLGAVLDPAAVADRLERLQMRGELQLDRTRLAITISPDGGTRVGLSGPLSPRQLDLVAGLPLQGVSGTIDVERLLFEDERVRGWGRVSDISMLLAEREFRDGNARFSYVDGRLVLEGLDAELARTGRIRSAGSSAGGGKAVALDLGEPFHFELGLELEGVDLDLLLRDILAGSFEDAGALQGQFQLEGSLGDPLDIRGNGWLEITDAKLWSIPMARAFFSRFGATGVSDFDTLRYAWRLADGVFHIDGIRLRSPILSLEGTGSLDMDGSMAFDLFISYSAFRYLGPLGLLLYWIQDSLLRVTIRGSFQRPRIIVNNVFKDLFLPPDLGHRGLPLPPLTPLPQRF